MRKVLGIAFTMLIAFTLVFTGCQKTDDQTTTTGAATEAAFHIGIVTGSVSQSEDDLRGAEELIKLYGDARTGGMISHITYPDNFMDQMDTTISQILSLELSG